MKDPWGRIIDYMRISITDRCNLRCRYCMPKEGVDWIPMSEILTLEEILKVAACGADLGIRHIKVTGGEPLVRKGCCHLIRELKRVPGIEKVTITTNGILLGQYLKELREAGIDGINVSLDTTDRGLFKKITGTDGLRTVLESIKAASALEIPVKINAVSVDWSRWLGEEQKEQRGIDWKDLLELARTRPIDVRFIEMMPIGSGKDFPAIDHERLLMELKARYPGLKKDERVHGFGPAVYHRIPGFEGSIGFISAIHGKFCDSCNRVRLTSQGYLKACLCYEDGVDLRPLLRGDLPEGEKREALKQAMGQVIAAKPMAHCFDQPGKITEMKGMSCIGG